LSKDGIGADSLLATMHDSPERTTRRASARRRLRPLLISALLVLLLPASGLATSGAKAVNKQILSYTKINFSYQIFYLSPSGSQLKPLITWSAPARSAVESPDGSQIAFVSTRADGAWNVYLASADGKTVRQLTNDPNREALSARWSPDGQKIVFTSHGADDTQIRTIRVDGSDETVVTSGSEDVFASYSPDGTQIAFERGVTAKLPEVVSELWKVNADGSNPSVIVSNAKGVCGMPDWSPDGNWIAFCGAGPVGTQDVWIVHPDGSALTDLTPDAEIDLDPAWSNDSQSVLFDRMSTRPTKVWSLFSVSVQGGDPVSFASFPNRFGAISSVGKDGRILLDTQAVLQRYDVCVSTPKRQRCYKNGRSPSLSPDGKRVLFVRDGRLVLSSIASGKTTLLKAAGRSIAYPAWSPNGHSITFLALDGGGVGLFTLDMRGRHKRRLLLREASLGEPDWGKNGLIAYEAYKGAKIAIWVIRPDGRGRRSLISNSGDNSSSRWSPDGNSLAFVSDVSGVDQIYVRRAAGGKARAVTSGDNHKSEPFWSPDGFGVAYTESGGLGDQRFYESAASGSGTTGVLFAVPEVIDHGDWR
jgi:Tol biopolymer transport system component